MRYLVVIVLSGIFCLFYSYTAQSAEIKIIDNNVFVETDTYQVQFTDGVITHLSNKLTEETYTLPLGVGGVIGFRGRSGLLKRDGRSIWTDQATLTEARKIAPLKAEIVFRQGRNEFRLFIGVDARSGDLLIEQEGTSDTEGVYGIQWGCINLNSTGIWISFFQRTADKLLTRWLHSLPEIFIIPFQVGKSNLLFFKENRAVFSFGAQMRLFSSKHSTMKDI